ncbi:MAG: class I SAM-dependent RNA methyltransferase [Myxococcales bacterium]|nr:class I SAM-dependent RNA methyltransferase [Myxococcales bacterium]
MSRPKSPGRPVTASLEVTSIAPGGFGVAHVEHGGERRAVFVPHAAKGDRLLAEVSFGSRPARARVLEITAPSADRRPAGEIPCAHLDACGACDFMHLRAEAQGDAHVAIVRASLPAGLRDAAIERHPTGRALGARERARVHIDARRGRRPVVGMFARGTHTTLRIASCVVLDPALDRVRDLLVDILDGASGEGEAHLAMGRGPDGAPRPTVVVTFRGEPLPGAVFARAEAAVRDGRLAGISFDGAKVGHVRPTTLGADGKDLVFPAGGFAQANGETNAALANAVGAAAARLFAASTKGKSVLELYAGSGNLTVALAAALPDAPMVAIEASEDACDAMRTNLGGRGLGGRVRVVHANADDAPIPDGTRVVVLDPPRAGARAVCERLARSKVTGVVMVSCDPPTLGRDLGILDARFELVSLTVFEMFPETSHVETLAVLRARERGS